MRAIYYDTETTGLSSKTERVIEIALYDPDRDATFERLVNPGKPIPSEATAVHGISDEMVADKGDFASIIPELIEFCEGDSVLIAHNNDTFDIHFMRSEFAHSGVDFPDWRFLDSLKWARKYRPDLPRHALQFLREIYGVPANNAHRALDDVIVLHKIFMAMIDDLSIDKVYELYVSSPSKLSRMPFGKHRGVPLEQVPKSYLSWLSGSGALDKPENGELLTALRELDLVAAG